MKNQIIKWNYMIYLGQTDDLPHDHFSNYLITFGDLFGKKEFNTLRHVLPDISLMIMVINSRLGGDDNSPTFCVLLWHSFAQ